MRHCLLLACLAAPAFTAAPPAGGEGPRTVFAIDCVNGGDGGFILPGARVDVVSDVKEGKASRAAVVERGLLVVEVEQELWGPTPPTDRVTVSVTGPQARRLAAAAAKGALRPVLVPTR